MARDRARGKPDEIVVFSIVRDSACAECGAELWKGRKRHAARAEVAQRVDEVLAVWRRWLARTSRHVQTDDAATHIERCAASWDAGSEFVWLIEDRSSGRVTGSIAARPGAHGVSLGYLLAKAFWGRGFMTEALEAVTARWLAHPAIFRVWATCDVENGRSARTLERAGFGLEGTLRRWDVHPNVSAEPRDALCYSRVR